MSRALLDINVLLALFDSDHIDHRRAHEWLDTEIGSGWASCPITQNGFVRVISQPRYPNPIAPHDAIGRLGRACATEHHEFWACDVSVLDPDQIDPSRIHGPRQLTDAYLLSLAIANRGRFVTFDQSVPLAAVPSADEAALVVI